MKFLFKSVRTRLLLIALLVEAVMLSLLVFNSMRLMHTYMAEQLAQQAKQISPILVAAIVAPLVQNDYATVQAVLTESQHGEGIKYLLVTNLAGRRVAQVGWSDSQALPEADADIASIGLSEGAIFHVREHLVMFGQKLGTLYFGLDLSPVLRAQNVLQRQGALIALSEMLLSFIVLSGLMWWITRNLNDLILASQQVAQGNFDHAAVKEGSDECGQLGAAFNAMSCKLNERFMEVLVAKEELSKVEQLWSFALEGGGDGVWDWDLQSNQVELSKAGKMMFGFAPDEIGADMALWIARVHPEDFPAWSAQWRAFFSGHGEKIACEYRVLCKDGHWLWVQTRGMVVARNAEGQVLRMVGTHTDISIRKTLEEQVRQLAFYDALTQLPNRRLLHDRLLQVMVASKRSQCYAAVMFLDLDNFKPLNDAHGHDVGDLLLVEVAQRLRACVRETDTVARFGGDEFVVLLGELTTQPHDSTEQASLIAEKILDVLSAAYVLTVNHTGQAPQCVEHHCSASIGVAMFINHVFTPDEIMQRADEAMYQAKQAGRNTVRFYAQGTP